MRLDGELKASWTGKGPEIRTDEFTIDQGCIVGKQVRLWTSPPVWYSEFVQQLPPGRPADWSWNGRLELTLFVSKDTAQGLRTGKLFQARDAVIDGFETNFHQPDEGESCYHMEPLMFCADDGRSGYIHFPILDPYGDAEKKEPVGSALARMIGKALGYP